MNRQVGPSIVLSVFIVCFFAVALFRHDQKRPTADGTRKHAFQGSASPEHSGSTPKPDFPAGLAATSNGGAMKPGPDIDRESTSRGGGPRITIADPNPPTIRPASVRSQRASEQPAAAKADFDKMPAQHRRMHQPHSAFTVVRREESIADVAVRIYGSTDAVEELWRANRDLLPERDSALASGTFLRTPNVR
jgi:hypothetical protein